MVAQVTARRKRPRNGKALRVRERYFGDVAVFTPASGGYSPLPWVFRRALWLFSPRAFEILIYLMLRAGPEGVCWQTDKEIGFDLDLSYRKVAPHMKALVRLGFIRLAEDQGQRFICIPDPLHVLATLAAKGDIPPQRLDALNDNLDVIGLPRLEGPPPAPGLPQPEKEVEPPEG